MARPRRNDGGLYKREESKVWWMRYRDATGTIRKESTGETDRQQADAGGSGCRDRSCHRDRRVRVHGRSELRDIRRSGSALAGDPDAGPEIHHILRGREGIRRQQRRWNDSGDRGSARNPVGDAGIQLNG